MHPSGPGPVTRRLLASLEAFSHEEDGAAGQEDWPALAALLEREVAVVARLAEEQAASPAADADTLGAVTRLRTRHRLLAGRIAAARAAANDELSEMRSAGRRLRAVRGTYYA